MIKYRYQKYSSFCYYQLTFLNSKGVKLGVIENKKQSELKKLIMLGQKPVHEERTDEIVLKQEEIIVGVKLGMREPLHVGKGKKEEGIVASIQFVLASI